MVGTGKGAEQGILIKGGESLERIHAVRAVLLDKTGTITKGKPELTNVVTAGDRQANNMLRLAASAEQGSEHPLASAIVEGARARGLTLGASPERFTSITGRGLEATVEGHVVLVGTRRLLSERSLGYDVLEEQLAALEQAGKTTLLVAIAGEVAGLVAVADTGTDRSRAALKQLHAPGHQCRMITRDYHRAAQPTPAPDCSPAH